MATGVAFNHKKVTNISILARRTFARRVRRSRARCGLELGVGVTHGEGRAHRRPVGTVREIRFGRGAGGNARVLVRQEPAIALGAHHPAKRGTFGSV